MKTFYNLVVYTLVTIGTLTAYVCFFIYAYNADLSNYDYKIEGVSSTFVVIAVMITMTITDFFFESLLFGVAITSLIWMPHMVRFLINTIT